MKNSISFFCILAKRLLSRKGYWLCLLMASVLSLAAVGAERRSDTAVYAAVYGGTEEWEELLAGHQGMVRFISCDSEEEVKRNVMQKKAECGYILQEDLQTEILSGSGSWAVTVYENADSTLTDMVNEVVFERMFYAISSDWYEGYIAENSSFAKVREELGEKALRRAAADALSEKLTDSSTFSFERQIVKAEEENGKAEERGDVREGRSVYPVRGVAAACILLSGIFGGLEAASDRRKARFYKKPAPLAALYTTALPALSGTLAAVLILLGTGGFEPLRDVPFLFLLITGAVAAGMTLQWLAGSISYGKE